MKPKKLDLKTVTAIGLLTSGIVMAFIALFLPPPGVIDDSVLYLFAQILIYVGSIFGIEAYVRERLSPRRLSPRPPFREGARMRRETREGGKARTKARNEPCGQNEPRNEPCGQNETEGVTRS